MGYTDEDCIGMLQLAGWMTGQDPTNVSTNLYRTLGCSPSYRTIVNRFGKWSTAKQQASETPQHIPTHTSKYFQSIAALRRFRDLHNPPVTGLRYREHEDDIGVSYITIVNATGTWTRGKHAAFYCELPHPTHQ